VIVAWLVLGTVLLIVEMQHVAFFALFAAVGCFAAAAVAALSPDAIWLQGLVAVVAAVVGIVLFRPYVSAAFHKPSGPHVTPGVHGGLVGQEAVTLDEVGDAHSVGHARLAGERWLAISGDSRPIPPGTVVTVTGVVGTTLVVWSVEELFGGSPASESDTGPPPDDNGRRTT